MEHNGDLLPTDAEIREALTARRRRLLAEFQEAGLGEALVLAAGGLVLGVEGSDQHYGFRVHDDHYYLSGARLPGQVLACDPARDGSPWTLFAYVASQEDRVWLGTPPPLDDLVHALGIDDVRPVAELAAWLDRHRGRPAALLGHLDLLERPAGYGLHPEQTEALDVDAGLCETLAACVVAARRQKDDVELAFMRAAAAASRAGHLAGLRAARVGLTERALGVEVDAGFLRAGAERRAYASIAVAGPNCAVLHAAPGARRLAAGDLVLVDAGAEVRGYDSDVTRTWPVSPAFTGRQRAIYDIVLSVQKEAIEGVRAGVEFRDLHMKASRSIAAGLVDFGILRGRPDDLVAEDAHALFFPHGLGHLIGLATHDVGGYLPGRQRSDRPGLRFLRTDTPLEDGYVVTIEPGIYFVPALLEDAELRRKHAGHVDWAKADAMKAFGGVRIEDDVVVTAKGGESLTNMPRGLTTLG
jgi:Xaa-Pro aminopeptidase